MPKCHQVVLDIRKVDQCHLLQVFSRVTHLATKVVGSHKESKGTKTVWFPRFLGSSETVAKGPNKFDEIFHGVKPENSCRIFFGEKKNNQPNEPTNSWKISLLPEFLRSFGRKSFQQKWFLSMVLLFVSNTYHISQKTLSNASIPL